MLPFTDWVTTAAALPALPLASDPSAVIAAVVVVVTASAVVTAVSDVVVVGSIRLF